MTRHRPSRRTARVVMWAGITGSALLLIALLARGWGRDALTTAAAALFLLCVASCIWAGVIGKRSEREVRQAVERLAAARHAGAQASHRDARR